MKNVLLHIRDINVNYDQHQVLKGVNMEVEEGEIICITGKNGSGKSTLLKSVAGIIPIQSGEIIFKNQSINNLSTRQRIQLGVGYLMQKKSIFPRLSVADHILLAAQQNKKQSDSEIWKVIDELLPQITQNKKKVAGLLSGGQSRFLSLAMLIAQGADKLWMLDEPSAGIAKSALDKIEIILMKHLKKNNITCLLVEQNATFGRKISTREWSLKN